MAGLGVGGIAVALAVQNILGDLFSSVSIIMDKPFEIGDFIVIGENSGTVEKIGLKTTRIRSITGEQLIVANSDLLQSRIRNFKRMNERRVVFSLGVAYQTPREELGAIPGILQGLLEGRSQVRFERAHFKGFGDFALQFECVYWITTPDYKTYMDIQQTVNMEILEEFSRRNISFAYPTQTLYVQRGGSTGI